MLCNQTSFSTLSSVRGSYVSIWQGTIRFNVKPFFVFSVYADPVLKMNPARSSRLTAYIWKHNCSVTIGWNKMESVGMYLKLWSFSFQRQCCMKHDRKVWTQKQDSWNRHKSRNQKALYLGQARSAASMHLEKAHQSDKEQAGKKKIWTNFRIQLNVRHRFYCMARWHVVLI